jgi:dolichol-phosphate mannosyltransferase
MTTVDLILPVYNEEAGIARFHAVLSAALADLGDRYRFRFLYVLDRSTDGSLAAPGAAR